MIQFSRLKLLRIMSNPVLFEHKEWRSQIIKSAGQSNLSEKYKKKWFHNTLNKLGIDFVLFAQYGINNDLYNIIAGYLIGFPIIKKETTKLSKGGGTCCYCGDNMLYSRLVSEFKHRHQNEFYRNEICSGCIRDMFEIDIYVCDVRPYIDKSKIIKKGYTNLLLWAGLINFSSFSDIIN